MAKTIQELRREKGFRSAREFAEALDISPSSMSRYDKEPEAIPVKVAWAMADALDCSIDEIVGREHIAAGANALQEFYDGLLPETRALFDELVEFADIKDQVARANREAEENRKDDELCRYHERMFNQVLNEGVEFGDMATFNTPLQKREAFEQFLLDQAAEKRKPGIDLHCEGLEEELRGTKDYTEEQIQSWLQEEREQMNKEYEQKDKEVIDGIMKAYDRLHATELSSWADGRRGRIEYAVVQLPK